MAGPGRWATARAPASSCPTTFISCWTTRTGRTNSREIRVRERPIPADLPIGGDLCYAANHQLRTTSHSPLVVVVGLMSVIEPLVKTDPALVGRRHEILFAVSVDLHRSGPVAIVGIVAAVEFV